MKNKKTPNIQYLEFFFYLVFSLEVISKSVLKGVFLVEKGECRRKSKSLDCCGVPIVGWIFFLTFKFELTTNKFNPSPYWKDYKHRIPIHNRITELMNEGLGYKRIHKVLVKEGFEVGKSPNCVNSMIKKRLKREKFLTQGDEVEYKEFKIMGMKKV